MRRDQPTGSRRPPPTGYRIQLFVLIISLGTLLTTATADYTTSTGTKPWN